MFSQPGWTCRDCGAHWPCDTRRMLLTAEAHEHSATIVCLFLSLCLDQAAQDQPTTDVRTLYEQFLGWFDLDGPTPPPGKERHKVR